MWVSPEVWTFPCQKLTLFFYLKVQCLSVLVYMGCPALTQPADNSWTSLTTENMDAHPAKCHSVTSANCSDCIARVQLLHMNTISTISSSSPSRVTVRLRHLFSPPFLASTKTWHRFKLSACWRWKQNVPVFPWWVHSLILPEVVKKCYKSVLLLNNHLKTSCWLSHIPWVVDFIHAITIFVRFL